MSARTLCSLALAICVTSASVSADPLPCPDPRFVTDAPDMAQHTMICAISSENAARMESCGLTLARPLLIEIVETVEHPIADCLAAFDCAHDRIRVTDPARYPERIPSAEPYADLPPDILLGALLTHELAHATVEHSTPDHAIAPVDHEYIAAAMELDTLPPEWRQHLLDRAGIDTPLAGLINIWIYRLEPRRFSANAWLHFSDPAHGCDLVARITSGRFSFAASPAE
ncbi:DUF6639 family protein [Nioella aestuarii]|uniref:DUF6639 family protein n=1 Tax=Nioella aestuarii TaxID=1662864 RepID=UPI003D7F81E9